MRRLPRQMGRYLAPEVEHVIMRALAKNPVERYQSAGALSLALNAAVRHDDGASRPAANSQRPAASSGRAGSIAASAVPVPVSHPSPQPAGRASKPTEELNLPEAPRPPRNWRQPMVTGLSIAVILLAVVAWVLVSRALAAPPVVAVPQFAPGAGVRVAVAGSASTSVLRGCPSGFWMGVLGLATDGDTGHATARQVCDNQWWYEVSLPGSASSAWDGQGWISGVYLVPR